MKFLAYLSLALYATFTSGAPSFWENYQIDSIQSCSLPSEPILLNINYILQPILDILAENGEDEAVQLLIHTKQEALCAVLHKASPNGDSSSDESPSGTTPSSENPSGQSPSGKPSGQYPSGKPSGQYPSGQSPSDEIPSSGSPSGTTPSSQNPSGQSPSGKPSGQYPSGQYPSGQSPSDEIPSSGSPSGTTPSSQYPSGQSPSGTTPSSENPSGQYPSGKNPSGKPSGQSPSGKPSGQYPSGQSPSDEIPSSQNPSGQSPSGKPSGQYPSRQSPSSPTGNGLLGNVLGTVTGLLGNLLGPILDSSVPTAPMKSAVQQISPGANPTVAYLLKQLPYKFSLSLGLVLRINTQNYSIDLYELEQTLSDIAKSNNNEIPCNVLLTKLPGLQANIDSQILTSLETTTDSTNQISYPELINEVQKYADPATNTIDSDKLFSLLNVELDVSIYVIFGSMGKTFSFDRTPLLDLLGSSEDNMPLKDILESLIDQSTGESFLDQIDSSASTDAQSSSSGSSSGLLGGLLSGGSSSSASSSTTGSLSTSGKQSKTSSSKGGLLGGLLG